MKPSDLQTAIFRFVKTTNKSLLVRAVAGSGKTTTTIACVPFIGPSNSIIFLAFNKLIVEELKQRIPRHASASTFNSLGNRAIYNRLGRVTINKNKTRQICKSTLTDIEYREYQENICKLIGLAKSYCLSPEGYAGTNDTDNNYMWLIDRFGIDVHEEQLTHFIEITRDILRESINQVSVIDFDDQLYLPVVLKLPMMKYDVIFVDECQDVSIVKLVLIRKSLAPGGRVIAVGDKKQAINGFTGSDENSIEKIRTMFNCEELPLSTTYRCAKNIVLYANQYVKEINAFEDAPDGCVCSWISYKGSDFRKTDLMMCRNTAPLISMAYACIARRVPVKVLGREIGAKLINLIDRLKPAGLFGENGLGEKLREWKKYEVERLVQNGEEEKAEGIIDRHDSIIAFLNNSSASTLDGLKYEINSLFNNDEECLTLCTIHKAKGLEAPRAFILDPELMPSKWARQEWAREQEQNLMYVSITRAKTELVFIRGMDYEVIR